VQKMGRRLNFNRSLNILNLFITISVYGTGLVLFIKFHIGDGAYREEWLGLGKNLWLTIHQVSAIGFLTGLTSHLQMHWKYIKKLVKRWRISLPNRRKLRVLEQVLLFLTTLVVMWAGFYPWAVMPEATLEVEAYHDWIDIHNRVGIFLVVGIVVHVIRRWWQLFGFMMRKYRPELSSFGEPADRNQKAISVSKSNGPNKSRTKYIYADKNKCEACWDCIDQCKRAVLGKVNFWFHKHVIINNALECCGCKNCVSVCPNNVFKPIRKPRPTRPDPTRPELLKYCAGPRPQGKK
jgi:NAD-dependent dihydropyrimidine dehydrogenase PreA subunit